MTRKEARLKLREATGCSMSALLTLIPEPGASREILAGMALQGMIASGASGEREDKCRGAVLYADALLAALAEMGEEPGVPTVDECERIAYGAGFKAGIEAAARAVKDTDVEWSGIGYMKGEDGGDTLRAAARNVRALSPAPVDPPRGEVLTFGVHPAGPKSEESAAAIEALVDAAGRLLDSHRNKAPAPEPKGRGTGLAPGKGTT